MKKSNITTSDEQFTLASIVELYGSEQLVHVTQVRESTEIKLRAEKSEIIIFYQLIVYKLFK